MILEAHLTGASMKALPKRKGNYFEPGFFRFVFSASMKALPKRKGNTDQFDLNPSLKCLNESPSEKEGKSKTVTNAQLEEMKRLNESPSEKEGK